MSRRQNGFLVEPDIALIASILVPYNYPGGSPRLDGSCQACVRPQRVVAVRKKHDEYKASQNDHNAY